MDHVDECGRRQRLIGYGLMAALALGLYALHAGHGKTKPRTRRANPRRRNPGRTLTPEERHELEEARSLSTRFHGVEDEVIELDPHERTLPRFAVALGRIPELSYEPSRGSERGGVRWEHEAGDFGPLRKRSRRKPMLAADPRNGRPFIVPMRSPVRFDAELGLLG